MLADAIHSIGLNRTETTIYLFLLEQGLSTPTQIAKGTGILRTNCYHVLQSLEAQGLIQREARGKRQAYLARDPEAFYQGIERKRETIARILPDLRGLYTVQKNKPKIQFYEGIEQIKEVYMRSLKAQEIYAIGSTHALSKQLQDVYKWYVRQVKERKIVFHDILTHASRDESGPFMQALLKGMYDMKYLPAKYGDIPTDLLIWDDCIAHITLEEPVFATVITSPLLARTMRTLFQVIHERL